MVTRRVLLKQSCKSLSDIISLSDRAPYIDKTQGDRNEKQTFAGFFTHIHILFWNFSGDYLPGNQGNDRG